MSLEAERFRHFEDAKVKLLRTFAATKLGIVAQSLGMRLDVVDNYEESRKIGGYPVIIIGPEPDPNLLIQQRDTVRVWVNPEHTSEISVVLFREVRERRNGAEIVRGHTLKRETVGERGLKKTLENNLNALVGKNKAL